MSSSAAALNSFFSTGLVLTTLCQNLRQRLVQFTSLVSYYLHNVNMCTSVYFILQHCSRIIYTRSTCAAAFISFFNTGLILPTLCQKNAAAVISFYSIYLLFPTLCQLVLQRLIYFSELFSYYLHYIYICCSGYYILLLWSRIIYILSTCDAAVNSFFNTGLVLTTLYQHVLQRLVHFSALVSYYLHYFNMCCSG
jgi:hypothetical protein